MVYGVRAKRDMFNVRIMVDQFVLQELSYERAMGQLHHNGVCSNDVQYFTDVLELRGAFEF